MKTAGTVLASLALLAVAATPALAGKKKQCRKHKTAAAKVETRSLSDELSVGITLAAQTGEAPKAAAVIDRDQMLADANKFDLSKLERDASMPTGDADTIRMDAEPLSQSAVANVVQGRGGDIEYCWARLPASERGGAAQLTLHLTIESRGNVSALSVGGAAPAKFSACLGAAAAHWQFPVADTQTMVDYPLVLN